MYLTKTPCWLKKIYPNFIWSMQPYEKAIYLTFDDGPHEIATPFVLQQLSKYNAKATFFCIGKNVEAHPLLYQQIIASAHSIGNHTQNHLNGWKTNTDSYLKDILKAKKNINSNLFRPPYGKMKRIQAKQLLQIKDTFKIIMWDVLSGDFDTTISGEVCSNNVIKNATNGSIVVFHDSLKAMERLQVALPKVLQHFSENGFVFKSI